MAVIIIDFIYARSYFERVFLALDVLDSLSSGELLSSRKPGYVPRKTVLKPTLILPTPISLKNKMFCFQMRFCNNWCRWRLQTRLFDLYHSYQHSHFPSQGYLPALNSPVSMHLYTWVKRGTNGSNGFAQEHNTMSSARARTGRDESISHEATAPPK